MSRSYNKPSTPKSNGRRQASGGKWWEREPDKDVVAIAASAPLAAQATEAEEIPWHKKPSYQNSAQRQAAAVAAAAAAAQDNPATSEPTTTPAAVATENPAKDTTVTRHTPPRSPAPSPASSRARLPQTPKTPKTTKTKGNWWDREPEADVEAVASTPATKPEPASPSPKAGKRAPGGVMSACAVAASSASTTGKDKQAMAIKEPAQPIGAPRVAQLTASASPSPACTTQTTRTTRTTQTSRTTRAMPTTPSRSSASTRTKPTTPSRGMSKAKDEKKWWMDDRSAEPAQLELEQGGSQANWWDRPCLLNSGNKSGPPSLPFSTSSITSSPSKFGDCPTTLPTVPPAPGLSIKGAALAAKLAKVELAEVSGGAGEGGSGKLMRKKASCEKEVKKAEVTAGGLE